MLRPKLSIVFSFRNEEEVIPELVQRVRAVMDQTLGTYIPGLYELVFVNDASTDRSLDILRNLSLARSDIRVITMSRRFGVAPCVMAGLRHTSGELVVYMDADLQDPPELIPSLVEKQRAEKADVVHSVRQSRKGEGAFKLFITRIGYLILHRVTHIRLPVEAGDFKLLTRRVVDHLAQFNEKRPFMRGLACWVGFKQAFVPYHREPRFAGRTKFRVVSWDVVNNFFESALISFSSVPLRLTAYLGFCSILLTLVLLGHVAFEKLNGRAIPGWTAIMVAIIFIGSIQLFCMGIMGLYISTIYEEVKGRPSYIVASTFGFPDDGAKP